jgi:hypothetical protein
VQWYLFADIKQYKTNEDYICFEPQYQYSEKLLKARTKDTLTIKFKGSIL